MACVSSLALSTATFEARALGSAGGLSRARKSLRVRAEKSCEPSRLVVRSSSSRDAEASRKVEPVAVLSALTVAAALLPEVASAAQPGMSPSLTNLLYSILAGGVVLAGLGAAVVGVSLFDPVKRSRT
jgi:hypothetical protein